MSIMKLSTKARYAVRALIDLAVNYENGMGQVKKIAENQELSVRYIENLFTNLRAAGILQSFKGKGGGFSLNRDPDKINLLDVIQVVEGDLSLVGCVESSSFCKNSKKCTVKNVWTKATKILKDYFRSVTLKDMIRDYKKHNKS